MEGETRSGPQASAGGDRPSSAARPGGSQWRGQDLSGRDFQGSGSGSHRVAANVGANSESD